MDKRPARYRQAIVSHIYIDGASAAIDFYKRAFGATEVFRVNRPDGRILHGEILICGSVIMIGDPDDSGQVGDPRRLGGCSAGLHIFTDDNRGLMERAVRAGAQTVQKVTDLFYGASAGVLTDPYGHRWVLLSFKEDMDPAEIERRGNELQASASATR